MKQKKKDPNEKTQITAPRPPKEEMEFVGPHLSPKQVKTMAAFASMRDPHVGHIIRSFVPAVFNKKLARQRSQGVVKV